MKFAMMDCAPNAVRAVFGLLVLLVLLPFLVAFKLCESLRNGVAWLCEKWLKKPFFVDNFSKSYYEKCVQKRQQLCPHLKGAKLVESELSEPFTFALISRSNETGLERLFDEALFGIFACFGADKNFEFNAEKSRVLLDILPAAQINSEFINSLYELENALFAAHKSLVFFGLKFAKMPNFKQNFSHYKIAEKYTARLDKAQIDKLKATAQGAKIWLDNELKSLDDTSFQGLDKADKKQILNSLKRAEKIYSFINGEFDLANEVLGI